MNDNDNDNDITMTMTRTRTNYLNNLFPLKPSSIMEGGELYQVSRGKGSSCSEIIAIKDTKKIPLLQCSTQMVWLDIPLKLP